MKARFKTACVTMLGLFTLGCFPFPAFAACTSPAGIAGTMEYFTAENTFKFCNGTSWIDMGGGGGGSLADLSDVVLTNPQEGQPLVYDAASSKWVNASCDTAPDNISFTNVLDQEVNTLVTSNIIALTGIGCTVNISVSGVGAPQYRICSDAGCAGVIEDWTPAIKPIIAGQYLQLRQTTGATYNTNYIATLTVGSSSAPWGVKTIGPKTVFATSQTYTGNLGGLAGADNKCQTLATAAGLLGVYKAWLSDSTASASSRLTHSTRDYVLLNNVIVANGWADLVDGGLDNYITRTENNSVASGYAWTGTASNGSATGDHCNNWSSASPAYAGTTGNTSGPPDGSYWSNQYSGNCTVSQRLYCIEQ